MRRRKTILIVLSLVCMTAAILRAADVDLRFRCEYRESPLGVDTDKPRLSWIVVATDAERRGVGQTAYQIIVAGTREQLDRDQGDLWDTGKVVSDETIQVPYGGSKLGSGQQCWWKVRTWDRHGQASPWSEPATWTMGLLDPSGGDAKWIGSATKDGPDRLPLLRREFNAPKPIRRAIVSVCGLGQYELRLNGSKVGDQVLDPGWTNYRKACLYTTYDVTEQVRNGKNCLAAMLGNGMYRVVGGRYAKFTGSFGPPKMILHLRLDFADGTTSCIVSDNAWRVAPGQSRSRAFLAARTTMRGWNGPAGTSPASTMPDGRPPRWSKAPAAGSWPSRRRLLR